MPKRCIMISMKNYIHSSLLNDGQESVYLEKQEIRSDQLAQKTMTIDLNSKKIKLMVVLIDYTKGFMQTTINHKHLSKREKKKIRIFSVWLCLYKSFIWRIRLGRQLVIFSNFSPSMYDLYALQETFAIFDKVCVKRDSILNIRMNSFCIWNRIRWCSSHCAWFGWFMLFCWIIKIISNNLIINVNISKPSFIFFPLLIVLSRNGKARKKPVKRKITENNLIQRAFFRLSPFWLISRTISLPNT